jgi:hypothetical protein
MQLYDFVQPRWYHRYPATLAVDGTTPNKLTQNDADLLA